MITAQEYRRRMAGLGLDKIEISVSSIPEANAVLGRLRDAQKQLRQIKREINQDMKIIRAEYTQKSTNAASGTSTVLTIIGKQKAAGQARAGAKSLLRSERDNILQPYESLKLSIDDFMTQLDTWKAKLQTYIDKAKAETQVGKDHAEAYHQSLLTLHLNTPHPDTEFKFVPQVFDVPGPTGPVNDIDYSTKPRSPILAEVDFLSKIFGSRRKQIENTNQKMLQKYEERLARWKKSIEEAEERLEAEKQDYRLQLKAWEDQKTLFEQEQENRRQLFEKRLSDVEAMRIILSERIQSMQWPIDDTAVSFQIQDSGSTVLVDVKLPEIENWPIEKTSATQRQKNYIVHIHSIGFCLIGEVFSVLPAASTVVLSGYVKHPSKTTGQLNNECVYSTKVLHSQWLRINFERLDSIDVVECFEFFETRRKITKQGKISPIEPFPS